MEFSSLDSHSTLFFTIFFRTLLTDFELPVVQAVFGRLMTQLKTQQRMADGANNAQSIVSLKKGIMHFFLQQKLRNANKELTAKDKEYAARVKVAKRMLETQEENDEYLKLV